MSGALSFLDWVGLSIDGDFPMLTFKTFKYYVGFMCGRCSAQSNLLKEGVELRQSGWISLHIPNGEMTCLAIVL